MTDRARLAKIPQPETALKCPRCDSTNTKFCYFNNYSLSQPRHFCKTCRRYWTRGGALRNVPVGGGCRRNKRSKANNSATSTTNARSKSPVVTENNNQLAATSTTTDSILFHAPPPPQLPILPPLHHFSDFNSGIGFGGIQGPEVAAAGGGGGSFYSSSGLVEQWSRSQQHPFLSGGLEPTTGLYSLESDGVELTGYVSQLRSSKPLLDNSGVVNDDQFASVKREDNNSNNNQGLNLSRNFLGISGNDHQYWGLGLHVFLLEFEEIKTRKSNDHDIMDQMVDEEFLLSMWSTTDQTPLQMVDEEFSCQCGVLCIVLGK
ncbi:hypothetical protein JRO89_XS14G0065000 [Xanthoceras sorbifolium]|uniref:Dof zinc finger protein n=1 Tax=Xanthoceras sorbifolium TaxID=99658 RepID=A0ABQ8H457_9ROSI|nr:hypothetical protein JRO89_XS14G0065000 [Xanthoceras sorbifolium]